MKKALFAFFLVAFLATASSTLYGVQSNNLAQGFQLAIINTNNGSQTKLGSLLSGDLNVFQQVDVDAKNKVLYALLSDTSDRTPASPILKYITL